MKFTKTYIKVMHTKHEVELIVRNVLNLSTDVKITDKTNLKKDLGMDSLDLLEISLNLEKDLDEVISDEELEKVVTFEDLVRAVNAK